MVNTKTTTPINVTRYGTAIFGVALAVFSLTNIFTTMTPTHQKNDLLISQLEQAQSMPIEQRLPVFKALRDIQATNLAHNPSDPFGWARLSYLRLLATGDQKSAFNALAMSNFISPYEPSELPERALMWYRYRAAESKDEALYQDSLWQKAYRLNPDLTWSVALQNKVIRQVEESLKRQDVQLYKDWINRETKTP